MKLFLFAAPGMALREQRVVPRGQFPRDAVPWGAPLCPLPGGGALESLCLLRGRDGRRSGAAWERSGERDGNP